MALSFQTVKNSNNVLQTVFQKAGALKKKKSLNLNDIFIYFLFVQQLRLDCLTRGKKRCQGKPRNEDPLQCDKIQIPSLR